MHLGSPSLASESIGCTHSIYIYNLEEEVVSFTISLLHDS